MLFEEVMPLARKARHCSRARLLLCVASLALPFSAQAQTVSGSVHETSTRGAIARAEIALLDSAGRTITSARTSDSGQFVLRLPGVGRYRLTARRLGFTCAMSPWIAVESVGFATNYDFELTANPQALDPVATTATGDPVEIGTRFGLDAKNINAFVVSPDKVKEYAASAHSISDVIRRIGIPGGLGVREEDSGEPCIVLIGRDRHCMLILVDNIVTDHVRDIDLNTIVDIVVMRPNEAGLWFGSLSTGDVHNPNQRSTAGGALLIRTMMGTRAPKRP